MTKVTVEIEPAGAGECDLTLTHEGVLAEWRDRTTAGWAGILRGLASDLAHREECPAEMVAVDAVRLERLLPGPIERVWSYLVDSEKRAKWLGAGELPAGPGNRFSLHFVNGELSPEACPPSAAFADRQDCHSSHRLLRCEPPHTLAFEWFMGEATSEVLFELATAGHQVRLTVTHRNLPDRETLLEVSAGWQTHLGILLSAMKEQPPLPFWPVFEKLVKYYTKHLPANSPASRALFTPASA
jgi:uncharacterized protein YndB with AHSA1/START domain